MPYILVTAPLFSSGRRRPFQFLKLGAALWLAAAPAAAAAPDFAAQGNVFYYQGELQKARTAYERAVAASSMSAAGWLEGAVVLEETGASRQAVRWYERAAALSSGDADIEDALGWALFRSGKASEAKTHFERAIALKPDHAYALLGAARVHLRARRPAEALGLLDRAAAAMPLLNLVPYYKAQASEMLKRPEGELEAYRQAVNADSYFLEGREALGRAEVKRRNYNEAWRQLSRVLDVEPRHRRLLSLVNKIRPLLTRKPSEIRPLVIAPAMPYLVESAWGAAPGVPLLRVGIGTNSMGKPMPRPMASFSVKSAFSIVDPKTGRKWTRGDADEAWKVRVKPVKKKLYLEIRDEEGKVRVLRREPVVIRPDSKTKGFIVLDKITYAQGSNWTGIADKTLRGELELSLTAAKASLKLVNIVDLEDYTHGVLAAEMPIQSPLEALKAQAVVARSHALYIKNITRRHRKDGYDVCDEQHCQVYTGVRAESARSRDVAEATRGRIVTYGGKVAHVIYSSNCGGHTENGRDLVGWGDVPYWTGVRDAQGGSFPDSPWGLRQWLRSVPSSFCKPSTFVHPSHYRWTRVIAYPELEEKIDRRFKTGRLLSIQAGRRSRSGNINTLFIAGSKRRVTVTSETTIRGLLGLGSLRSTMFVFNTELGPDLKPESLVFSGGGWGHGVGLCQSGAMGRAEAGQTYEEIIKAYFKGTELGQLKF